MIRELRLEGDNRIFQPAMPNVAAAWIGEEAVAIEYRLDRSRAPGRARRKPREGCEPADSRLCLTCVALPGLRLNLRLAAVDGVLEAGNVAEPRLFVQRILECVRKPRRQGLQTCT